MNATLARLTRLAVDLCHEPDSRLLDRFLAGSEAAFRELVTRHSALVYGVCHRILRHRQDAEDAYQAVFLVLARRAGDVWPRDAVGSWLFGVASRVALKARCLRARRMSREQHLVELAEVRSAGPEPDTAEVIDRVVRKLPEVYRAAVIACDLEGLSRKDAAGQLGWSEGTLSGRLARARRLLADRLRRAGLALPAGGLAAVLGTDAPVRAGFEEGVMAFVSPGAMGDALVPAPVAALTEGVVSGMIALNFKSVIAAVVVVCTIGLGAWAGAGDGSGTQPAPAATPTAQLTQSRPKATQSTPAKLPVGLELLQGRWRIAAVTEGGITRSPAKDEASEITITGATLRMPYREVDGTRKLQEYKITVDETKRPMSIDLISSRKPVGQGIYEFMAPQKTCTSCHDIGGLEPRAERQLLQNWLLMGSEFHATCQPGDKVATGMRLAIALEGERPTRFAGDKVIVFTLQRFEEVRRDERDKLERETARLTALLDSAATEEQRKQLRQQLSKQRIAAAELEVEEARAQLRAAAARSDEAQAQVEQAAVQFTLASRKLQEAQARLDAAEKAVADAGQKQPVVRPAKDGDSIAIHIRPLAAPEKVIRVKATGNDTVLEALAHAAQDMAIKPDELSAWVVRGKEILTVDLPGLMQKNETKTNYILKAGDQLFIQTRVGK